MINKFLSEEINNKFEYINTNSLFYAGIEAMFIADNLTIIKTNNAFKSLLKLDKQLLRKVQGLLFEKRGIIKNNSNQELTYYLNIEDEINLKVSIKLIKLVGGSNICLGILRHND